jgi:hypothetical protein
MAHIMRRTLPISHMLQLAFRYGDPIMVIVETVEQMKHDKSLSTEEEKALLGSNWWLALLTTRVLLAHAIYVRNKHDILTPLIANIRNVLRVVGVDICDKDTMADFKYNETVLYQKLQPNGKFWLSLKHKRDNNLTSTTFDDMNEQLITDRSHSSGVLRVFELFARAVHELVSTRDTAWTKTTRQYQHVALKSK